MHTILIIDDNPSVGQMLRRRLTKLGYQIFLIENSNESGPILEKENIDLVLLDQMMPDMSGFDFYLEYQTSYQIPVIMMTAYPSLHLAVEFLKLGGADFVQKPIDIDVLHVKINRAIKQHHDIKRETDARRQAENRLIEANQDLMRQKEQLEEMYHELDSFASTVSHDLKNPLRNVILYTQLLQQRGSECLDGDEKEFLQFIESASLKMNHLITEILAFSRRATQTLQLQEVDTAEIVHEILNTTLREAINTQLEIHAGMLPKVQADPVMIQQVFINLIHNAIKYSGKEKKPMIEIHAEKFPSEVVFSVKDNGVGFDMKKVDRLFQMFSRLHGSHEFVGTGVGLAHVKRIIERHNGKIWAEAKKGEGATFSFSLPI